MKALKRADVFRALRRLGFQLAGEKGRSLRFIKPGTRRPLIIPNYREIPLHSLLDNLESVGISANEFDRALGQVPKRE